MWRSRAVYKCPGCGSLRKSARAVYKFDVDDMHWELYERSPEMIKATRDAQELKCEKCG